MGGIEMFSIPWFLKEIKPKKEKRDERLFAAQVELLKQNSFVISACEVADNPRMALILLSDALADQGMQGANILFSKDWPFIREAALAAIERIFIKKALEKKGVWFYCQN